MKLDEKVCVVGAGSWGKNHIHSLSTLGALGGIVEKNSVILDEIKNTYTNIEIFNTVSEALLTQNFSGYVVATPAETHFEIAMEIINAHCHVLVEKPVTLKVDDIIKLKNAADLYNVNLMAGHILLFHPAIQKIKTLLDMGVIGKLQYIYSNRLNLGVVRQNENVFWSLAPHDISIFQHFIKSKPLKITSLGASFLQKNIHDTTLTVLEYECNVKGHIFVSWIHPFKEHRLMIVGSEGMISFEDSAENRPLKLYEKKYDMSGEFPEKKDGPVQLIPYGNEMPLLAELKYFIDHLDGRPIKIATAASAVDVVEVLVGASKSLRERVSVE